MNYANKQTEFVVFCIENTAKKTGLSGKDIYERLKRTDGIQSFLYPSYETLHTQGKDFIVEETIRYLNQQPDFTTQNNNKK